ncbi:MAG: flagellar motor protein MotB [Ahrensia sp.]|nr:flagellar motor protein MotB [Ahrensia sp.]
MSDEQKHQEIIIIKRGGEGEHGHHGGAWKIAFADFMTAMMALFLVLWLINAANEETKKAVASYFNPVKLVDRNRSVKGLHDAEGVQEIEVQAPNEQFPEQNNDTEAANEEQKVAEAQFFADPFTVLDQIADHKAPGEVQATEEEGGRNGNDAINDAQGGEAFMDPFSPNFWNEEVRQSNDNGQLSGQYETDGVNDAEGVDAEGTAPEVIVAETVEEGVPATDNLAIRMGGKEVGEVGGDMNAESAGGAGEGEVTETAAIGETPEMAEAATEEEKKAAALEKAADELRGRISEKLAEVFGDNAEIASDVSVEVSGGEILISLTDALDISMFELGSAVPSQDLVLALEKIGGVLAEQNGGIRIHGHTDARPFRSKDYDNWRLSASRAQSAYYMLLRGGLDETRVREISGFADRKLVDTEDPFSPANRRIEVLVEVDAG